MNGSPHPNTSPNTSLDGTPQTAYAAPDGKGKGVNHVTVVVADGHAMVRQGICSLLANTDGIEIVGQATTGNEAIELARRYQPTVALMDVRLPEMNGIDATAQVVEVSPRTCVLGLSAHDDAHAIQAMLKAGGRGFIHKDASVKHMIDAIHTIGAGELYLCPRTTLKVIDSFVLGECGLVSSPLSVLTPREREVAQLLSEGHSTRAIAEKLHVSIKTIDTHRYQVLKKLELRGIADLTRFALREGLSTLNPGPMG